MSRSARLLSSQISAPVTGSWVTPVRATRGGASAESVSCRGLSSGSSVVIRAGATKAVSCFGDVRSAGRTLVLGGVGSPAAAVVPGGAGSPAATVVLGPVDSSGDTAEAVVLVGILVVVGLSGSTEVVAPRVIELVGSVDVAGSLGSGLADSLGSGFGVVSVGFVGLQSSGLSGSCGLPGLGGLPGVQEPGLPGSCGPLPLPFPGFPLLGSPFPGSP